MDEQQMEDGLVNCVTEFWPDYREDDNDTTEPVPSSVRTFSSLGILTKNKGLVVRMSDGSEFQLTIVQSKQRHTG
jgi:hypothetical protein